ncbi:CRISPR-associated DxTHG motif protein [Marinithermus hydrothermalis]
MVPYRFPDGTRHASAFFGVSLFEYFHRRGETPDLLIVGTSGSTWQALEDFFLLEDVGFTAEAQAFLDRWHEEAKVVEERERLLADFLGVDVTLLPVEDPPSGEVLTERVFEDLSARGSYDEIILDITHAYRFMGYVLFAILLSLRHVWRCQVRIFYGGVELPKIEGDSQVIELKALEDLVRLDEALSILQTTGNFVPYFALASEEEKAQRAYLALEVNRQENVASWLKELAEVEGPPLAKGVVSKEVKQILKELEGECFEDKLINRARFFFERDQVFKAVLLLYEGLVVAGVKRFGLGDPLNYEMRRDAQDKLEKLLRDHPNSAWVQIYKKVRLLRNAVAHGTRPRDGKVQQVLGDWRLLKDTFQEGLRLYQEIKKDQ